MKPGAVLIVSGGAEAVSAVVLEWAHRSGRSAWVFALSDQSILRGLVAPSRFASATTKDRQRTLEQLSLFVAAIDREQGPVVAFPTEDDSLGLLVELTRLAPEAVSFSRCRALASAGLDKSELFQHLIRDGLARYCAETVVVRSTDEVRSAAESFGNDVVIKPSHKPWSRDLSGGAKVFGFSDLASDEARAELNRDFAARHPWVVQRRLSPLDGGERSAIVVRTSRGVRYAEVLERAKYPQRGGSACWVETAPNSTILRTAAIAVVESIDLVGLAELSFLSDADGQPRLLELNARPWLQIELMLAAGFDVLDDACAALLNDDGTDPGVVALSSKTWISIERFMLKAIRRDGMGVWRTLALLATALARRPIVSVWSTRLPGLRCRWLAMLVRKALARRRV